MTPISDENFNDLSKFTTLPFLSLERLVIFNVSLITSNVRYFFDSSVYVRQTPLTLTLAPLTNFVLNLLGDLMHRFQ